MTVKRRVKALERKAGVSDYLPIVVARISEGDDIELAIEQKLKEEKYKRHECQIKVVEYVKPKQRKNS